MDDFTRLSPDYDDEGNLDVEWYPVPKGLWDVWDELQGDVVKAETSYDGADLPEAEEPEP